jgi:hypothetical protein
MPHCLATRGSMACSAAEFAAVLTVLATILSSWRVLYPNSGSFEGEGIVVGRGVLRRAEEAVDGDPYGIQWQAWWYPVLARPTALELLQQCPAWCCKHGGGRTGPTVAGMASHRPSVMVLPCRFTRKQFEGVAAPPL